jgi:hypothetical protein
LLERDSVTLDDLSEVPLDRIGGAEQAQRRALLA